MSSLPVELTLSTVPTLEEVRRVRAFLLEQGSLNFPTLSSGLFSAAASESDAVRATGYQYVWARDNCHIIHALWKTGQKSKAAAAATSLLNYFQSYHHKFIDIIEGTALPSDPMNRPHIRFDGETLSELDVRWSHAQNDALGYSLWIFSILMQAGDLELNSDRIHVLRTFIKYFQAIRFWEDEDSGHWEETRKIQASSIGTVVAGLTEFRSLLIHQQVEFIDMVLLNDLILQGRDTLSKILPAECTQDNPLLNRRYDASLLFLIYPLDVVDQDMATQILTDVETHLTGPIGIRRYLGDSYWCANYRDLLSAEIRTTDFSDDLSQRDKLFKTGEEAQWCLFDPIVSTIWGRRFQKSKQFSDLERQIHHFKRSLNHLTYKRQGVADFRFPESYFLEGTEWVPNDICPLLWTQANVLLAIQALESSLLENAQTS